MHKSLALYCEALDCSASQVRRYIRAGLLPSAQLQKGPTGRPAWVIKDTTPKAIQQLNRLLQLRGVKRPVFMEPVKPTEAGGVEVYWRAPFDSHLRAECNDLSLVHETIDRLALLKHGLRPSDLLSAATPTYEDRGGMKIAPSDNSYYSKFKRLESGFRPGQEYYSPPGMRVRPEHEAKILEYERTKGRLIAALFKPETSFAHQWIWRFLLSRSLRAIDIDHAAAHLALHHRIIGIEINYKTLARVLGMSKSAMYRTYGGALISAALKYARGRAASSTQMDRQELEQIRTNGPKVPGNDFENHDFHQGSDDILDVPFQNILDAAVTLKAAGQPLDRTGVRRVLRERGFRDVPETDLNHAIREARRL